MAITIELWGVSWGQAHTWGTIRCNAMGLWVSGTFRGIAGHWLFFLSLMSIELPCILAFSVLHDTDHNCWFSWFRRGGKTKIQGSYCWCEPPGRKHSSSFLVPPVFSLCICDEVFFFSIPFLTNALPHEGGFLFSHQRHIVDFHSFARLHVFPKPHHYYLECRELCMLYSIKHVPFEIKTHTHTPKNLFEKSIVFAFLPLSFPPLFFFLNAARRGTGGPGR